jgi:uncharacterized protein (TIGR04222 family)
VGVADAAVAEEAGEARGQTGTPDIRIEDPMNPLALPGPQFLLFYALFALAVLLALYFGRRTLEKGPLPTIGLKEPYLFACLSGGPAEVIRVATIGLVDRGLLTLVGGTAHLAREDAPALGQARIEKRILESFRGGASLASAAQAEGLLAAARADYEHRLVSFRLLPNGEARHLRQLLLVAALALLIGMGGAKIWVALKSGRTNVEFLIIEMILACIVAWKIHNPYRTRRGDDYLASVRSLFANLRQRADSLRPGSGSRDVLWLTALFGVAMLPSSTFPAIAHVWPRATSTSSGSGCGSSGGGSGCGGGGGGGGGCGGCGS